MIALKNLIRVFAVSFFVFFVYKNTNLIDKKYINENKKEKPVEVGASVGGKKSPDGSAEIICDLPEDLHQKNIASMGLGCCVFVSIHHSSLWQNISATEGIHKWMKDNKIPGGGYPEKVNKLIDQISESRGLDKPRYIQDESGDIEILKLALKTGRMPCVTYSYSPSGRYNNMRIAHMVNLVYADDKWFCILDNNYPGENNYEWLTEKEFEKTYKGIGGGWCIIFLNPPPPPPPKNS